MITEDILIKIEEYINDVYDKSSHRLAHIYGVLEVALKLGKQYNVDLNKIKATSLLHDATKKLSIKENKKMIGNINNGIPKACYHAYSSAVIAKDKFGIKDLDILNALTYHCSGRKNMSALEKVIYVADFIEEGREFCSQELKELAFIDLDLTVYKIMLQTKNYILKHKQEFSKLTEEAIKNYETNRRI